MNRRSFFGRLLGLAGAAAAPAPAKPCVPHTLSFDGWGRYVRDRTNIRVPAWGSPTVTIQGGIVERVQVTA